MTGKTRDAPTRTNDCTGTGQSFDESAQSRDREEGRSPSTRRDEMASVWRETQARIRYVSRCWCEGADGRGSTGFAKPSRNRTTRRAHAIPRQTCARAALARSGRIPAYRRRTAASFGGLRDREQHRSDRTPGGVGVHRHQSRATSRDVGHRACRSLTSRRLIVWQIASISPT